MSRMKSNRQADLTASKARRLARQAAAQVGPVAAQAKPLAKSTGAAASRSVHRTRAWVAPRVERTGQVLQDSVAPKVSSLLSSAARRLEPTKPRDTRWRKLVGISLLTAAAGAGAALARKRSKPDAATSAAGTDAGEMTSATEASDGKAKASTDAEVT
jgi:hypothetical protein